LRQRQAGGGSCCNEGTIDYRRTEQNYAWPIWVLFPLRVPPAGFLPGGEVQGGPQVSFLSEKEKKLSHACRFSLLPFLQHPSISEGPSLITDGFPAV
jgi:hypothetical protein